MNTLEEKYLNGTISKEEIEILDKMIAKEPDDAVLERMYRRWLDEEIETSSVERHELTSVWTRVYHRIEKRRKTYPITKAWRWLQIASVILLPFLAFFSFYFYQQHSMTLKDSIVMTTSKGEKAHITLPDGSRIILNQNSTLVYQLQQFNGNQRMIDFDGEAYFDVAKEKDRPFLICSDRLKVQVLGTKFNLFSRKDEQKSFLELEEGSVSFTDTKSKQQVQLFPGQQGTLDKTTGNITVDRIEMSFQDIAAWRRNEIVFHRTPLHEVIKTLEDTYNVTVRIKGDINTSDLYTGTMSSSDMQVNLAIIERLYHIKTTVCGKEVIFEK